MTQAQALSARADVAIDPSCRVVLDCRWLGMGGAGRVTELVLEDVVADPPAGRWTLWGRRDRLAPYVFPGAAVAAWTGDPRALFGQRDLLRVPRGDVVLYLHQVRPLRPGRSVTFILDTIPVRHGGGRPARLLKRAFFLAAARLSTRILTLSEFSRRSLQEDLGVAPQDVALVPLPEDEQRSRRIAALRREHPPEDVLLYVGRFDRHKNLERLCLAFERTEFSRLGGRLLLVGAWPGEAEPLQAWLDRRGATNVEISPQCSDEELDRLLATSRALAQPSLEEGYGLPAFEAAAAGLPVAASRTGGMVDLPPEAAVLFAPEDVDEMARALDEAVSRPTREAAPIVRDRPYRAVLEAVAAACAA